MRPSPRCCRLPGRPRRRSRPAVRSSSRAAARQLSAVSRHGDGLTGRGEHLQLLRREHVDDVSRTVRTCPGAASSMARRPRSVMDTSSPRPSVHAIQPLDQLPRLHPLDVVRQPALLPPGRPAQFAGPQLPTLGLRQHHQHLVIGRRQRRIAPAAADSTQLPAAHRRSAAPARRAPPMGSAIASSVMHQSLGAAGCAGVRRTGDVGRSVLFGSVFVRLSVLPVSGARTPARHRRSDSSGGTAPGTWSTGSPASPAGSGCPAASRCARTARPARPACRSA